MCVTKWESQTQRRLQAFNMSLKLSYMIRVMLLEII